MHRRTPSQRASEGFAQLLGGSPTGIGVAPGRVNLIGEHTDYNAGLSLPIAITQHTAAAAAPRSDTLLRIHSLDIDRDVTVDLEDVGPGTPKGWAGYVAGTLWALRDAGHPIRGLDLVIASDVPVGAGLSSSAAIEGATAAAAAAAFHLPLLDDEASRRDVARACQRAENEIVAAPTGGLDQLASLLCREDHALEIDFRSGEVEHVPFDLAAHDLALLVIDTRAHHSLADGQYGSRRSQCETAARELGLATLRDATLAQVDDLGDPVLAARARHVVTENERVVRAVAVLRADEYEALGQLFTASHVSLRNDYEVSAPELDVACEAAIGAGALGARMTGGGFGGSAIALVPRALCGDVAAAVDSAFSSRGFGSPSLFDAIAGPSARVVT